MIQPRFITYMVATILVIGTALPGTVFAQEEEDSTPDLADTELSAEEGDSTSKRVDILYAENLKRFERNNLPIREWSGAVRLRQEEVYLWADLVTEYLSLDEILLKGNVLIVQESDSLFADSVLYYTGLKEGIAQGNVRLSDGEVEVFAPRAHYYTEEKHTSF